MKSIILLAAMTVIAGASYAAQTETKSSGSGVDSVKPGYIKPVATPEPRTAAPSGRPPTSGMTQALPRPLKALRVSPNTVAGGNQVQGTVELVQPPGPNGVTVKLESGNPQIAGVPSHVTVTHGVTSAETGPIYTQTFVINTQSVQEDTSVAIRARAGTQTLEVNLRIRRPSIKSASLDAPNICDGSNKGKVSYTLTGPAPSGLKVFVRAGVQAANGQISYSDESETVSTGNSAGSIRIRLPRCQAHNPGQRCLITGTARVEGSNTGVSHFGSGCGHPPD